MKDWQAKLLGFSMAWWLLLQAFIDAPALGLRIWLGLAGLIVGTLVALSVATGDEPMTSRIIASWFLRGVASMLALILGFFTLSALLRLLR